MIKGRKLLLHPHRRATAPHIARQIQKLADVQHGDRFLADRPRRLLQVKLRFHRNDEYVILPARALRHQRLVDDFMGQSQKIGAQAELAPADLIRLTRGKTADLIVSD